MELFKYLYSSVSPSPYSLGRTFSAIRFLRTVDDLRRLAPPSPAAVGSPRRLSASSAAGSGAVQVAMARLEDEFRHVLSSRALDLEIEALADLSSLSINSDRSNSASSANLPAAAAAEDDSVSSSIGHRSIAYRSLRSIREIDLLPDDAVTDLRAITSRMAAAGYGRECAQVYASVCKPAVDASLRRLDVERLSIGDVQCLEWAATGAGRHVASSRKRKKADLWWARRCRSDRRACGRPPPRP